jgi:hypothetical protein
LQYHALHSLVCIYSAENSYIMRKYIEDMNKVKGKTNIPFYLVTTFLSIFLLTINSASLIKTANGDGLFMEELSANFGDRKADLIIKMMPPVVTTDTLQNQNQKPIIHVT